MAKSEKGMFGSLFLWGLGAVVFFAIVAVIVIAFSAVPEVETEEEMIEEEIQEEKMEERIEEEREETGMNPAVPDGRWHLTGQRVAEWRPAA